MDRTGLVIGKISEIYYNGMKIKGIVGVVQIENNDELETQIQYDQTDHDDMV
jgi:hypothetical protein